MTLLSQKNVLIAFSIPVLHYRRPLRRTLLTLQSLTRKRTTLRMEPILV